MEQLGLVSIRRCCVAHLNCDGLSFLNFRAYLLPVPWITYFWLIQCVSLVLWYWLNIVTLERPDHCELRQPAAMGADRCR